MNYDLLIYHDMTDDTESTGGRIPPIGAIAEEWFGHLGKDRFVVAVGPPIHGSKDATVVLAVGSRPMDDVQAQLDASRG